MPGPPQRQDFDTIIRALSTRITRLEQVINSTSLFLVENQDTPATPANNQGGLLYVHDGQLHYVGGNGTDTVIGPA